MNTTAWLTTVAALAQNDVAAEYQLTTPGWIVMVSSITVVLVLVGYCLVKVLSLPPVEVEQLKGPLDIDTGDTKDAD